MSRGKRFESARRLFILQGKGRTVGDLDKGKRSSDSYVNSYRLKGVFSELA
jgi:hypothetical protein